MLIVMLSVLPLMMKLLLLLPLLLVLFCFVVLLLLLTLLMLLQNRTLERLHWLLLLHFLANRLLILC